MRSLGSPEIAALAKRAVALRNLVWITAKERTTGTPQSLGFWDDVGNVTHTVIDALTGGAAARTFVGAGSLLRIEDIAASADLSIKTIRIELSGINSHVAQAVRGYDPRLAPIQIYRVVLDPASGNAWAPARARFVGIVDTLDIRDPPSGGQGEVTIQAVSQLRELSRANPDMTSNDSQKLRLPTDQFYQFANDVAKWTIMWGAFGIKHDKKDKKDKKGKGKGKNGKGK